MVSTEEYNLKFQRSSLIIVLKTKIWLLLKKEELSMSAVVLVENGVYKGYTFYDLNYQITNIEILKTYSFRCKITVIAISFKDI
jgi:DNA polymerase-3 subunit epsilon